MRDRENRDFIGNRTDSRHGVALSCFVQRRARFIEKEKFGIGIERTGDGDPLTFTAR